MNKNTLTIVQQRLKLKIRELCDDPDNSEILIAKSDEKWDKY